MLHLTLVRHGSTRLSRERRYQGWTDEPLSPEGAAEARLLGERLRAERFDRVVTSDLSRARETAALALPEADLLQDPRLREMDFGAWDALTYDEAARRDRERIARWIDAPHRTRPPGGESLAGFRSRVAAAVDALPREGEVLLVAHGGPLRAILARALGLRWRQVVLFQLSPCGVTRVALHRAGGHLLCLNDTAHLAVRPPAA